MDILRVAPGFSYKGWVGSYGLKDLTVAERLLKNLAVGGLPE